MSDLKKGDKVSYMDGDNQLGFTTIDKVEGFRVYGTWSVSGKYDWVHINNLRLVKSIPKIKPAKNHTETERRNAAKAVRVAEKKLKDAIKKAGETGISVKDYEHIISTWVIDMSYQPETPKKRVYK